MAKAPHHSKHHKHEAAIAAAMIAGNTDEAMALVGGTTGAGTEPPEGAIAPVVEGKHEFNPVIKSDAQILADSKAAREAEAKAAADQKKADKQAAADKKAADKAEKDQKRADDKARAEAEKKERAEAKAKAKEERDARMVELSAGRAAGSMLALADKVKQGVYVKSATGQLHSGDALATALDGISATDVIRIGLDTLKLEDNPYAALNVGQQSMNLRNRMRGAIKKEVLTIATITEYVARNKIVQVTAAEIEAQKAERVAKAEANKADRAAKAAAKATAPKAEDLGHDREDVTEAELAAA